MAPLANAGTPSPDPGRLDVGRVRRGDGDRRPDRRAHVGRSSDRDEPVPVPRARRSTPSPCRLRRSSPRTSAATPGRRRRCLASGRSGCRCPRAPCSPSSWRCWRRGSRTCSPATRRSISRATSALWFLAVMMFPAAIAFAHDGVLIGAGDYRFLGRGRVLLPARRRPARRRHARVPRARHRRHLGRPAGVDDPARGRQPPPHPARARCTGLRHDAHGPIACVHDREHAPRSAMRSTVAGSDPAAAASSAPISFVVVVDREAPAVRTDQAWPPPSPTCRGRTRSCRRRAAARRRSRLAWRRDGPRRSAVATSRRVASILVAHPPPQTAVRRCSSCDCAQDSSSGSGGAARQRPEEPQRQMMRLRDDVRQLAHACTARGWAER